MSQKTSSARPQDRTSRMLTAMLEFLRRSAPFSAMEPAHLEFLAKRLHTRYYPRGSHIACSGEHTGGSLEIIKQGKVQASRRDHCEDGVPLRELTPGDSFVIEPCAGKAQHSAHYQASEDTFCLELEPAGLAELLKKSQALRDFLSCSR